MAFKASYCCALGAAVFAFASSAASASTVHVGTCKGGQVTYSTVQSAVDAAANGDTVSICPGTYAEQITITKNVSLKNAVDLGSPVIAVPAGGLVANTIMSDGTATAAQILVSPPAARGAPGMTANVSGLTVDGANNNNTGCSSLEMVGIYYKGAAGLIRRNTVQNQITPGHENCQNGIGILVENGMGTDAVTVQTNSVSNFDKNGIVMRLPGSVGQIRENTVTGLGHTTLLAQNGILLRDSASANIFGNTVSGFVYTPDTFGSAGIILYNLRNSLYQAPPTIQNNTVDDTQFGIVLDGALGASASNPIQITANKVSNSLWDGIELESDDALSVNTDYVQVLSNKVSNTTEYEGIDSCGNHNTISKNTVTNSTNWAIHLDSLCTQKNGAPSGIANKVSDNHINTACVGILSGPAEGENNIGTNHFVAVTHHTIFRQDDYSCTPARVLQHSDKAKGKSPKRTAVSP